VLEDKGAGPGGKKTLEPGSLIAVRVRVRVGELPGVVQPESWFLLN
jgi:hypothetical protein